MPALESEVERACSEEDPASDKQTSEYEKEYIDYVVLSYMRREEMSVSTSDASTRESLFCISPPDVLSETNESAESAAVTDIRFEDERGGGG